MADLPIQICLPQTAVYDARSEASSPIEAEVIALFDTYRNRLFRYVLSFGLAVSDSEDVVQEVFLSLFRHLQLDRSRSNLPGWLFRVAHNLALKRRMSNQKSGERYTSNDAFLETWPDPDPDPEQRLALLQRQAKLLAIISALPEQDKRCLRLRAEGLKYRDIAEILGMSLGAVSNALTRSLSALARGDKA